MKKMLALSMIFIFSFVSLSFCENIGLNSKEEAKALCDKFMKHISMSEVEKAFDAIEPYFPIPETELYTMEMQSIKQLSMAEKRFGQPIGYEFVKETSVGDTLIKIIYMEKFENTPVGWMFIFYKPKDKWVLNFFTRNDHTEVFFLD